MDVHKALRELYQEKKRLDEAISNLERRLRAPIRRSTAVRRGRKQMSEAERMKVSKRMKQYWEARRAQGRALDSAANWAERNNASGASA
jgi:hypothetical protein